MMGADARAETVDFEGLALTLHTFFWCLLLASCALVLGISCSVVSGVRRACSRSISDGFLSPGTVKVALPGV